jgi:hypothetical protein
MNNKHQKEKYMNTKWPILIFLATDLIILIIQKHLSILNNCTTTSNKMFGQVAMPLGCQRKNPREDNIKSSRADPTIPSSNMELTGSSQGTLHASQHTHTWVGHQVQIALVSTKGEAAICYK